MIMMGLDSTPADHAPAAPPSTNRRKATKPGPARLSRNHHPTRGRPTTVTPYTPEELTAQTTKDAAQRAAQVATSRSLLFQAESLRGSQAGTSLLLGIAAGPDGGARLTGHNEFEQVSNTGAPSRLQ